MTLARFNPPGGLNAAGADAADRLLQRIEVALDRLAKGSQDQYRRALRSFVAWCETPEAKAVLPRGFAINGPWWQTLFDLMAAGRLAAITVVEAFLGTGCSGKAPATTAQRLAAIKWVFRLAYDAGLIEWDLRVRGPKVETYRDTRGPAFSGVEAIVRRSAKRDELIDLRDQLAIALLFSLGLRRAEATSIRVKDLLPHPPRIMIRGKGRTGREPVAVPELVVELIEDYLQRRGDAGPDAPLLASHDRARKGTGAMTADGLYRRVVYLAKKARVPGKVTPHGLRHSAVTAGLGATGGDVRMVGKFARHRKPETTLRYDDVRRDEGGQIASLLASLFTQGTHSREVPENARSRDQRMSRKRGPRSGGEQ